MSQCLEHPKKELAPGPDGALACSLCGSAWMTPTEVDGLAAGALESLTVETREKSGAFAKRRHCLECRGVLTPMRIGRLDGWVERCAECDRYWVDQVDRRSFQMLSRNTARQKAFDTLAPEEKRELASGIAESVGASHEPQLSGGQVLLAALGLPMLERVEGNRVPWMTWSLASVLVLVFVSGRVWPGDWGPLELAWRSGSEPSRIFWANFMHFNVVHLLGNVAFLLAFGDATEQRIRRAWLVVAFVVLGPITVVTQGLFTPSEIPIGGASGAISVLVGTSVILQPKARIIMVLFRRIPVRVPMVLFGVFEVGYQTLMALLDVPGVGWYAHLSGLLMGIGLAFAARHQSGLRPFFQPGAA